MSDGTSGRRGPEINPIPFQLLEDLHGVEVKRFFKIIGLDAADIMAL